MGYKRNTSFPVMREMLKQYQEGTLRYSIMSIYHIRYDCPESQHNQCSSIDQNQSSVEGLFPSHLCINLGSTINDIAFGEPRSLMSHLLTSSIILHSHLLRNQSRKYSLLVQQSYIYSDNEKLTCSMKSTPGHKKIF